MDTLAEPLWKTYLPRFSPKAETDDIGMLVARFAREAWNACRLHGDFLFRPGSQKEVILANYVMDYSLDHGFDDVLIATPFKIVDVTDEENQQAGINWWEEMTSRGGEGMVVKPLDFIAKGRRGLAQPAVKCRGREYLRIIYGPEYTDPINSKVTRSWGEAVITASAHRPSDSSYYGQHLHSA